MTSMLKTKIRRKDGIISILQHLLNRFDLTSKAYLSNKSQSYSEESMQNYPCIGYFMVAFKNDFRLISGGFFCAFLSRDNDNPRRVN